MSYAPRPTSRSGTPEGAPGVRAAACGIERAVGALITCDSMITFDEVTKRFGERLALDSVSWHMEEGECLVLLGPSGAGKTTVLRLITHEVKPPSCQVMAGTFRSGRLSRSQRALLRRTLGVIYEDFRLLNDRTVFENVALAVRIIGQFSNEEVIPRVLYAL